MLFRSVCRAPPSVKILFPSKALINGAAILQSTKGNLARLRFSFFDKQETRKLVDEEPAQTFSDINGQLVAFQCGWNEEGRVDALSLLFTSSSSSKVRSRQVIL